eukprot:11171074-Lingulodinium_polyedra.AAC.1
MYNNAVQFAFASLQRRAMRCARAHHARRRAMANASRARHCAVLERRSAHVTASLCACSKTRATMRSNARCASTLYNATRARARHARAMNGARAWRARANAPHCAASHA